MIPNMPLGSSEYFRESIQRANDVLKEINGANIVKVGVDDDIEHLETDKPDVIIIDGNGSSDTKKVRPLLVRMKNIDAPKILLLNKGATGLDLIKHYVDHIAFGKSDAERLARTIYLNRK